MAEKSIVGFVSKIDEGKSPNKGVPMWTVYIDASKFNLFDGDKASLKYLQTMKEEGKPVEVILKQKEDGGYFNFSTASPAPDDFLEMAQASKPKEATSYNDHERATNGRTALMTAKDLVVADKCDSAEMLDAARTFRDWLNNETPATTPQPHRDAPQPTEGSSEVDTAPMWAEVANLMLKSKGSVMGYDRDGLNTWARTLKPEWGALNTWNAEQVNELIKDARREVAAKSSDVVEV